MSNLINTQHMESSDKWVISFTFRWKILLLLLFVRLLFSHCSHFSLILHVVKHKIKRKRFQAQRVKLLQILSHNSEPFLIPLRFSSNKKVFLPASQQKTIIKLRMDILFRLISNNICGEFFFLLIFCFELITPLSLLRVSSPVVAMCWVKNSTSRVLFFTFSTRLCKRILCLMLKQLFPR